jgi:hypothetical protein
MWFRVPETYRNPIETNRILSGGWIRQDPIESGVGLMDLGKLHRQENAGYLLADELQRQISM